MRLLWTRREKTSLTTGDLAFGSLLVAVVSGIVLALPFDVHRPADSIALLLLTNPPGTWFRNIHYWSAQLFLGSMVWHAWRHLWQARETKLPRAVWRRTALSLPVGALLMLTGFVLRADAEGAQALRIVSTALGEVPLAGRLLVALLFGDGSNLQIVYVHHVATITVLVWVITAEHARAAWPRMAAVLAALIASLAVGLLIGPSLHDGLDPIVKGPWYFLGLQEALHWTPWPLALTIGAAAVVTAIVFLPQLPARAARLIVTALAAGFVIYVGLTVFAFGWRGANWSARRHFSLDGSGLTRFKASDMLTTSAGAVRARDIPTVLGRREGCLACHRNVTGLSRSHDPQAVGCSSCHGGNPFALDAAAAHRQLVTVPGNLADANRSCGLPACHPSIVPRLPRSIMTTMNGVVAKDRIVFGESAAAHGSTRVADLGYSPADTHLRQLCASCHLDAVKRDPGPVNQQTRGGGCNACHLVYTREALEGLRKLTLAPTRVPGAKALVHPNLSVDATDDHCFGCHSRSARVSINYEGWQEIAPGDATTAGVDLSRKRTLDDGRVFAFAGADVHHEKHMACIDCHTSREVMGDGVEHARAREQVKIACEDCHSRRPPATRSVSDLDAEAAKIVELRSHGRDGSPSGAELRGYGRDGSPSRPILVTSTGDPLVNTTVAADGKPLLRLKASGETLELRPPAPICTEGAAHQRLSCQSCHTAWAPRCAGCHTRFNPKGRAIDLLTGTPVTGAWEETGGMFSADPPTLGIRRLAGSRREVVDTFIPGMIATIERPRAATRFVRLFAPIAAHTIGSRARSCESCHNDPNALGYGKGALRYERSGRSGQWRFTPALPPAPQDLLPLDAWVGFLQDGPSKAGDVRPFSADEQRRILAVGACLTCHKSDSRVMHDALADFRATVARTSRACARPRWD